MSDKFYTNVQMYGNSILLRGYNNGERFTARENFYPTLYVSTKKETQEENKKMCISRRNKFYPAAAATALWCDKALVLQ